MTLSNDRDGGNSDTMGAGTTNGSTVNLQLASQLLNAISSGLASSSAGHRPHEPMNSSVAEAAGQMLLQHFGLQQAAQQRTETIANHSSPKAPTSHAAPPGVHDSKQAGHHGKTSGQQSSEKRHHHNHNHSDKAMPGTFSIVPCRARAMPPDHNSNSAVFKISRDVKHGEDLLCSFPQCRDGGVKFVYCLVCGIPVAKRNFRQRHDHGMANSKEPKEKRRGEAQPHLNDMSAVDASQLLLPSIRRHQHEEERPSSRQNEDRRRSHEGNAPHRNRRFAQRDHEQGVGQRSDDAPVRNLVFQRRTGRGQNPETIVDDEEEERQRRWRELLRRRPLDTEGDAMSKWLLAVLEISDPGGNSSNANTNVPSSNNNDRQHGSSESNEASNENESSSSYESSAGGSGANGGAGWNSSSSQTMGSGDSSGPSESSSGGGGHNERPQHQYVLPVVSDFRNSTEESPSGSNTDAGGVDTSTNDPTSGSGSNDGDTLPREASSSLSAGSTMGSSESGSAGAIEKKNYTNHHDAKRRSSSSGNEQMHVEKKMKHR